MSKYSIGIDFGTLSGRAVLVSTDNGRIAATTECFYAHGVMDKCLPNGTVLPNGWALQHPTDYIDVLTEIVPSLMQQSGVDKMDVIGIGTDFTSSTVMPVDINGVPLCCKDEYSHDPHAYVKHWKHHGAQLQADCMTQTAVWMNENWIEDYGGKVCCENAFTKLLEVYENDRRIYDDMFTWIEAADWIVWQLTGCNTLSSCCAGYKFFYSPENSFPSREYLGALCPGFGSVVEDKFHAQIIPVGETAGYLKADMAEKLGLMPGIPVAAGVIDAHASVPAGGITDEGQMLAIIGTSTCFMTMTKEKKNVPGISGIVKDGIIPGMYGYEAGQSCAGDLFQWYVEELLPDEYRKMAAARGVHIQDCLAELAKDIRPGESGLLALDWWNGNRSPLSDSDLSGMLLGLTLQTKPEEIYRALVESTAFGARLIVENYREHGVYTKEFFASGGISQKSPFTMQIYADVLNMPVKVTGKAPSPALGSAIWGAVSAGDEKGGYSNALDAIKAMSSKVEKVYYPTPENVEIYDKLYQEYKALYRFFGTDENSVMKRLSKIKKQVSEQETF